MTLVDESSRERVRTALDETLLVEAGAGSGKTAMLVSRILALIDSGRAELREIAAISFTEAAAAELRQRVQQSLSEEVGLGAEQEVAARRLAALAQLDEAAMTTIHGFAHRILSEHPLEAGLPLRFEVLDEIGASLLAERRFLSFVDGLYDDATSRGLIAAAVLFGVTADHLRILCRQMGERRGREVPPSTSTASIAKLVDDAADSLVDEAEAVIVLAAACVNREDRLFARLAELGQGLDDLKSATDWLDRLRFLLELRPLRVGNIGRQAAWPDVEMDVVRGAIAALESCRVAGIARIADAVMGAIGTRLSKEVESFAEERRRAGVLIFHDLLVRSRALVTGERAVRLELQRHYRYILIDEFQDTDPLQLELLMALGSDVRGLLVPGRLFFVGDPMQSIYRFRGADLELYEETRERLGGERAVRLETNFRSVPGIVAFVNDVFSRLVTPLDPEETSCDIPPDGNSKCETSHQLRLHAARAATIDKSPIVLLGGGDESLNAAERRERESKEIAAAIIAAVADGWPVEDDGVLRAASYRDIAVLVPVRTGLAELEAALEEAGIEYRLGESSLIYRSAEVRDVLAVLAAIDDRGDERDVVAALRTPAFGCSDRDLLQFRAAGGSFRLDEPLPRDRAPDARLLGVDASDAREQDGDAVVADALGELRRLRDERHRLGIVGTLEAVLERRHVRQLLAAGRHPAESLRRVEFILERARGFVDAGGGGLGELLHFFAHEAEVGVRRLEPTFAGEDLDAVRVLTVHGAKGLEFPVVMLAELGGVSRARPQGAVVLGAADGRIELSAGGERATSGFSRMAELEAGEARREMVRLCYVAATRARDHLVVSLHHRPAGGDDRSLAELIAAALPADHPYRALQETAVRPRQGRLELSSRPALEEAAYEAALQRRGNLLARLSIPNSVSATALGNEATKARPEQGIPSLQRALEREREGEQVPWPRVRASSNVGRAVHGVLQRVDLRSGEGLRSIATRLADEEDCSQRVDDIELLASAALAAPVVKEAANSPSLRRELPFSLSVDGGVLTGVVDLAFEHEGGLTLVDYKTDALADASEAMAHALRHRLQAGAYAFALAALTGVPVRRFVLIFLAPSTGAVEIEVPDLAAAVDAARAAIAQVFSRRLAARGFGA